VVCFSIKRENVFSVVCRQTLMLSVYSYIKWDATSVASLSPNLGTRGQWVVGFTHPPLYLRGRSPRNQLNRVLNGPLQCFSMLFRNIQISPSYRKSNLHSSSFQPFACSVKLLFGFIGQYSVYVTPTSRLRRFNYKYHGNLRINILNDWLTLLENVFLKLKSHVFALL